MKTLFKSVTVTLSFILLFSCIAAHGQIISSDPQMTFRQPGQSVSAGGLWRIRFHNGSFTVEMNTATAGNFSTTLIPLTVDNGGNLTFSSSPAFRTNSGSCASPAYSFNSNTNTGLLNSGTTLLLSSNGSCVAEAIASGLFVPSTLDIGFLTGAVGTSGDVFFSRPSTGNMAYTGNTIIPASDNVTQLGISSQRWSNLNSVVGSFGSSVASTGTLRLGNNQVIKSNNQAGNADLTVGFYDTSNNLQIGDSGNAGLSLNTGGALGLIGLSRLQFNGTTSSFPALKRVSTTLAMRLADDSGDAPITFAGAIHSASIVPFSDLTESLGSSGARYGTVWSADVDSNGNTLNLQNISHVLSLGVAGVAEWDGTKFQLGGTSSSFPMLKQSSSTMAFRLADDSGDAPISSAGITFSGEAQPASDATIDIGDSTHHVREIWYSLLSYATSDLTKSSDVTFATMTGNGPSSTLAVTLQTGGTYIFEANIMQAPDPSGGWQVKMDGGSVSCSASRMGLNAAGSTGLSGTVGNLTSAFGIASSNQQSIMVTGYCTVSSGGTLAPRVAQDVATGSSIFRTGSWLRAWRIN